MIEIKELLSRFNTILLSEEVKKNSIIDALYQTISIQVKPKDIKIKKQYNLFKHKTYLQK